MYEVTDKWLEELNEKFRAEDVPHKQRAWLAWEEWSKVSGGFSSLGDDDVKKIFDWFKENTKAGSQAIDPLFIGSFYFDSCFWPVYIPVICGTVNLDPFKSLRTLPQGITARFKRDKDAVFGFLALWADCTDYGLGIEELINNTQFNSYCRDFMKSGDNELRATVSLLHEERPNAKAVESARMVTEMFLKAFLASRINLTEKAAKKIGHDLVVALDECLKVEDHPELKLIRSELSCFPDINERYKGAERLSGELWRAYETAQFIGATVVRSLSGRDLRTSITLKN